MIDYALESDPQKIVYYEMPYAYIKRVIFPGREQHREAIQRNFWWKHARPSPRYRAALAMLPRYLVTSSASKHRIFLWLHPPTLADHQLIVFMRSDDYFFGILHSRAHEVWARVRGTQVRERESGFRYTPGTCFETFAFPEPTVAQSAAVAEAARDLDSLRTRWLNPPEWTREEVLEFPGSADGPWARLVHDPDDRGIGTVRYPVLRPKTGDVAKELAGRTLTNLYNKPPAWLEAAHRRLDAAVFAAYGWEPDLLDDEILSRLLALNLERAEADGPIPDSAEAEPAGE